MRDQHGVLYVVATPIGNLSDLSLRALETLKQVDEIIAEDTRHTQRLLQHYQITKPLLAYYEGGEREKRAAILARLAAGKALALVSDAGTPLISDPGYCLIRAATDQGFPVVPLPGACAAIAALSVSGLASDRFSFEGFLPAKTMARQRRLAELKLETRTLIFYEAPHRLLACLNDFQDCFGRDREAVLARELTKTFETLKRATLGELFDWVKADRNQQRGEIVLLVAGLRAEEYECQLTQQAELQLQKILHDLPLKKAVQIIAELYQLPKNNLYAKALSWQKEK